MLEDAGAAGPVVEDVVRSFMASMRTLWGAIPGAVWQESPDLVRYSTGSRAARFNGIVVLGPLADEESAATWLEDLTGAGIPHGILSRASAPPWVPGLAVWHRLGGMAEEPLMVHQHPAAISVPDGLSLTRVDPEDATEVAIAQELFAKGFEGRLEDLRVMMTADVLRCPGLSAYVGRLDGEPCTTGVAAVHDGHIGVFNIATPPEHRRRGHGHAVTAKVVAAGVAAGAHTAYLQASPMGLPVYERMGFRTVETWPTYHPAA